MNREIKFDFNDILITPATQTNMKSRSDINPLDNNGFLPLFTAPMDTVIDTSNVFDFYSNKINVCLPRNEFSSLGFNSYGLDEFNNMLNNDDIVRNGKYLIDIANGHMGYLFETVKKAKSLYPKLTLMVGNIANPTTYRLLSEAGADLIRINIGTGGACLTSQNTGIGYPTASLVHECYKISCNLNNPAKIIVDGGMKDYADIIKAIALGADYVMLGSILNKTIESCSDNYLWKKIKISDNLTKKLIKSKYKNRFPIYNKFRGMSTKEVQKKWGKNNIKTSEGIVKYQRIEYSLDQWVENFRDYLKSAMSYTNSETLKEFIGNTEFTMITNHAYKRFNK